MEYFVALANRDLAPFPTTLGIKNSEELETLADAYIQMLNNRFPQDKLVTDKRPDNFLYIGLIKTLFPKARIIHTTRDAMDNCLSVYFLELADSMSYAKNLLDTGHYYVQQATLMDHWKRLFPDDIFTMHYDTFVREPRETTEALLSFLDLPWNDSCLNFHTLTNTVKTESFWQVREPLYTRSSGRHRNYAAQLSELRHDLQAAGVL